MLPRITHSTGHGYSTRSLKWPPFMAALWNTAGHYIFVLWFLLLSSIFYLLSSFFPRLFSAVADWMSTTLSHMVWP